MKWLFYLARIIFKLPSNQTILSVISNPMINSTSYVFSKFSNKILKSYCHTKKVFKGFDAIAYILTYFEMLTFEARPHLKNYFCELFQLWFSRSTYIDILRHFWILCKPNLVHTYRCPLYHYVDTISNEILSIGMPTWHLIWIAHT